MSLLNLPLLERNDVPYEDRWKYTGFYTTKIGGYAKLVGDVQIQSDAIIFPPIICMLVK